MPGILDFAFLRNFQNHNTSHHRTERTQQSESGTQMEPSIVGWIRYPAPKKGKDANFANAPTKGQRRDDPECVWFEQDTRSAYQKEHAKSVEKVGHDRKCSSRFPRCVQETVELSIIIRGANKATIRRSQLLIAKRANGAGTDIIELFTWRKNGGGLAVMVQSLMSCNRAYVQL